MRKAKLVLKKDFWSKIENRLQHVVGLLGIAQQYWLRSLTQRQPDVIVSRLQLLQSAVQPDHIDNSTGTLQDKDKTPGPRPKAIKYSTDRRGQLMQKHRGCSWLGSVGLDWTQSRDDNQGTAGGCNTYYIQLKPPNWLTRKAWSVVSSLSVSGFDITLRAYSVVPRNSPVMECAAVGDVGGLLDLFDKGLASPFDIDPDGNGLLEVAIQREGVSALAVMMSWGLDLANCFEPTASRPTTMFFLLNGGDEKELQVINEMALASNVYETWADRWTDGFFNRDFYWQCMASNFNSVKVFLPRLRPGHYQLPIRDRLGWMPLLSLVPAHSLRYILWKDGKARMEDVRALDEIQYPLIKLVATRYNNPCAQILDVSADGARDLARQIIRCTTLLHSLLGFISIKGTLDCSQESFTALYCVARPGRSCYCLRCRTMTWTWKRRRTERGLRQWLEDVQAAGTDLREYGKIEAKIFQETESIRSLKYDFSYWDCGTSEPSEASSYCTLVAFTYGPEPKDWKFTWDLQCYEFAGEFWQLIENPPLYMVGGWDNDW